MCVHFSLRDVPASKMSWGGGGLRVPRRRASLVIHCTGLLAELTLNISIWIRENKSQIYN